MSHRKTQHIIIIGTGIGGLSAAIRLAVQGHHVQMLERPLQIGGKLNSITKQGFHFDTGPSLITMPFVLHDLFQAANRCLEDYLDLVPLDTTCQYFYRDGLVLNAWRDQQQLADEFTRVNPHDGEALKRFIAYSGNMFQAAADPFLYHSLGNPLNVMGTFLRYVLNGNPNVGAQCISAIFPNGRNALRPYIGRLRAIFDALSPNTLDQRVRTFFQDEHIRQVFDRYATYNGSSPYKVASVYSIIPYVELAWGGWYLRGGIYTLAQALGKLACELGVCIETNCDVRRILVERGEARGVVLADGRVLRGDMVIANSDVVTTHRELLSPAIRNDRLVKRMEKLEPSCSGFVLMLGVDKQYPRLSHHNIFFSDDYRAEFDDLFVRHIPQRDPTIYVCAATRTDATQAPPGYENLFVLVNAPYLTDGSNWKRYVGIYRDKILDILASFPQAELHDLREHIICEEMLTPEDFYEKYGANRGAIYGLSSNARIAPFTRPGNRSRTIRNLYFVGGSTHPGGGIPLVTLSGKIVAEMIESDYKHKIDRQGKKLTTT
jgi:phytoene desaturase